MNPWQRKIVLCSPFFYPELISTGKANQHLAEALAAAGNEVVVVCSHPLYPAWLPVRSDAQLPGMTIVRGGAGVRYPGMPLRRVVLESWFALFAGLHAWRQRGHADVALSILPPSLFAWVLHGILPRRVRRVAVVHDLQGVLAAQQPSLLQRAIIRAIHVVESRAFRSQDLCIFFSEDMARVAQQSYGLNPSRVAVQYPFVTLAPDAFESAARRLAAILPADRLHVVYSGALGHKQNSRELLRLMQAAARLHPQVGFHVFSGGPMYEELRAEYEPLAGPRVCFHPLVAECDLADLYARSAIQIIPQAEGTEAGALPSKLPNLLATGVHLLAICSPTSEAGRLIERAGTGTLVERWEQPLFLERLTQSLETVRREPASMRRSRVQPLLEEFSVTNLVQLVVDGPCASLPVMPEPEPVAGGAGR